MGNMLFNRRLGTASDEDGGEVDIYYIYNIYNYIIYVYYIILLYILTMSSLRSRREQQEGGVQSLQAAHVRGAPGAGRPKLQVIR